MPLLKLLQKVQKPSNLKKAWKELNRSNTDSRGLSSETIASFEKNLPENLRIIRKKLSKGLYLFSSVRGVVIKKKQSSGKIKKRGIRIAEISDRVVQRAIARVIEPILNQKFDLYNVASFAYLKKRKRQEFDERRSVREALLRMIRLYRENRPYVLEADIQKYFDTVDQTKLLDEKIFPALPDPSLNDLIKQALNQEIGNLTDINPDDWELFPKPSKGIPQGGGLSPLFANVYLSDFDKRMLDAGYGLVRYADDFIVVAKTKEQAKGAYDLAKIILEDELGLKLHPLGGSESKTTIVQFTQQPFEFLGICFNGRRLWPSADRIRDVKERIKEITEYHPDKNIREILTQLKNVLEGWVSAYFFTDISGVLLDLENYLRERLGVCAFRMGWHGRKGPVSSRQRRFSGIPSLLEFAEIQQIKLSEEVKNILVYQKKRYRLPRGQVNKFWPRSHLSQRAIFR